MGENGMLVVGSVNSRLRTASVNWLADAGYSIRLAVIDLTIII